jgi:hypothetical protein
MYTYESLAPFQLKHEFTMVVAGPSKSGKTEIREAIGTEYSMDFTSTQKK